MTETPLCVDLDGTLLRTDALVELFCRLLRDRPWAALAAPAWLLSGRPHLKRQIGRRAKFDVSTLPLHEELVVFLREEKARGRRLILVTASEGEVGRIVAAHLQLFDEVLGTEGEVNLAGTHKAHLLEERFGKGGFDYIGNGEVDLPVWAMARKALVVSKSEGLLTRVRAIAAVDRHFTPAAVTLGDWTRVLRVHQWSKNLLLFIPLLGAHSWSHPGKLSAVLVAFVAFSLCASSVYILNDLLDLEADRRHPTKRRRPFASGQVPLVWGLVVAPLLLGMAIAVALVVGPDFAIAFAIYYITTLAYSLRLKRVVLLDVFVLAALYSIRVLAGAQAARVLVSDWLLVFSIFLFLSLAFAKRFTELKTLVEKAAGKIEGRGYHTGDLQLVGTMGVASGYLAVLVLALYMTHPLVAELYSNPRALWFACPVLLYWISRVWLFAHRGTLNDDPILFALKDRQSWLILMILGGIGMIALPR